MKILGIDTIMHGVCVAVAEDNKILSNEKKSTPMFLVNQSLLNLTAVHVREIGGVLEEALKKVNTSIDDISLIAVNNSGSLLSNVLIGLLTANTLSRIKNIPIIDVSHQEGHIFSNWIERNPADFNFPILVFSASGGHSLTALILKDNFKYDILFEIKGIKKDSKFGPEFVGIGLLFSKVVAELGLRNSKERLNGDGNYIAQLAAKGNAKKFNFFSDQEKNNLNLDFNFTRLIKKIKQVIRKKRKRGKALPCEFIFDIAASFEDSLAEIIVDKLYLLAKEHKAKEIHLVGGVSANETIRSKLAKKTQMMEIMCRYPEKKAYCTDNAAMIANVGYHKFMQDPQRYVKQRYLDIKSDLVLERLAIDQFAKQNKELD